MMNSNFFKIIFSLTFFILLNLFLFDRSVDAKRREILSPSQIPRLIPIRYEVQLQMPTTSDKDPLIPTFFGSLRVEFQLTTPLTSSFGFFSSSTTNQEEASLNSTLDEKRFDRERKSLSGRRSPPIDVIELKFLSCGLESYDNITLTSASGEHYPIVEAVLKGHEVSFFVGESFLQAGRYILDIDRFQGIITYTKGIYYRDAGNLPVLGTEIFPDQTATLFPMLGGPLTKTTTKMTIVHPHNTVALSNMQQLEPTQALNKYWRVTRFVQAPNLAAYLLSMAILPSAVYERTIINTTHIPIYIWTNKLLHSPTLKQEIALHSASVFNALFNILDEPLPVTNLDVLMMNEFNGTHSFGLITLGHEQWTGSDEVHRISILARNFARQWIGGMTTISLMEHFCLQEDIVEYLVKKVIQKVANAKQRENYDLAQYIRINVVENFLAPGDNILDVDLAKTEFYCGLKGSLMLESLETIVGESTLVNKIKTLLRRYRYRSFHFAHFLDLLKPHIVDKIDLSQVYEFWFKTGGIPNVLVEKNAERVKLTQERRKRQTVKFNSHWQPMPFWPLRIQIRNVTLPFSFMLSQVLEIAPLDKKLLPLTNVGFGNLYRVNYDVKTWERILHDLDESLSFLTARTRAQLFNDFCYFSANGLITSDGKPLREGFLQLLRDRFENFELCEFYAFACISKNVHKFASGNDSLKTRYEEVLRTKVWPALWNSKNYECGSSLGTSATDAANQLCMLAFNSTCL